MGLRFIIKNLKNAGYKSRAFALALILILASLVGTISTPKPANAAIGSISEYSVPSAYSQAYPGNLTLGPDGKIWFTGYGDVGNLTTAGSFTDYNHYGKNHSGITTGSDGNIWYAEYSTVGSGTSGSIVKATTAGSVLAQYYLPDYQEVYNLTLGPDGNVWFTMSGTSLIGKITPTGTITEYSVGSSMSNIEGIAAGPDGNMWVTVGASGSYSNAIVKITTSGTITRYAISSYSALPENITAGPDGNMWFTESTNQIGKITMTGVITQYATSTGSGPYSIAAGSDGNLWFTEVGTGKIGEIIPSSGVITEYTVPNGNYNNLGQIIQGPDGAVWFAMGGANKIGRLATQLTNQTVSFTSSAPTSAIVDGSTYTPGASATSGLVVTTTVDSSASSVCSIDGSGIVTFQAAGTCVLDANQAGNADYNPALQVQQSFSVLPVDTDTSVALNCPATLHVGDTVSCTITVTNNGPAASQNTTLSAVFPNAFSGASLSGGGTLSGQTINWSTTSMAPGASTTFTFNATASAVGKVQISAALLQSSPDPDNSNNIDVATIVIS